MVIDQSFIDGYAFKVYLETGCSMDLARGRAEADIRRFMDIASTLNDWIGNDH